MSFPLVIYEVVKNMTEFYFKENNNVIKNLKDYNFDVAITGLLSLDVIIA
jgi:hypothetical protein